MSATTASVGNNVIFSNNVMLAGHCTVGDFAILGGGAAVIQFARVGAHAFVGGMSGLENDLIPYGMALGNRAHLSGLNIVGLQRRGFSRDDIHDLRRAYRLLFAAEGTLMERIEDVAEEFADHPIVQEILAFIRAGGKRCLCTPRRKRPRPDRTKAMLDRAGEHAGVVGILAWRRQPAARGSPERRDRARRQRAHRRHRATSADAGLADFPATHESTGPRSERMVRALQERRLPQARHRRRGDPAGSRSAVGPISASSLACPRSCASLRPAATTIF